MNARRALPVGLVTAVFSAGALPFGCAGGDANPPPSGGTGGAVSSTGGVPGSSGAAGAGGATTGTGGSVGQGGSGTSVGGTTLTSGGAIGASGSTSTTSGGAPVSGGSGGAGPTAGSGSCATGLTSCSGTCRNLAIDVANCGTCGKACAAGQSCQNSACTCAAMCNGACTDTTTDNANCGTCGNACPSGQVCSDSKCGAACASRLTLCGNACVDLNGSATNCGKCGNVCPMGQTCASAMCRCAVGSAVCDGTCQDISTNVNRCGTCTTVCAKGATCAAGVCACPVPQAPCNNQCLDVTKDPNNCGTCGTKCSGTTQCLFGACLDPSSVNCGSTTQSEKTCTAAAFINTSKYWINNNLWGAGTSSGGSQCIWKTCTSGDLVGWGTSWTFGTANPGQVKSYASIVVGWHWGWKRTDTGLPFQLSAAKTANCGWNFTADPGTGTIDVAYDLFAHTLANPGTNDDPTDEIMIWLYRSGGAAPIGPAETTVTLAGTSWELHRGKNDRWNVFSYVRTQNANTSVLNMMDFMKDLVNRGWIANTKYLTSIQAGTEVFTGTGQLDTSGFYCRIQ
jgi:hypothetical protein